MEAPEPAGNGSERHILGDGRRTPQEQGGRNPQEQAGTNGDGAESDYAPVRLTAWVRGRVQGVGFRWWTRARARELGLCGRATNLADGRVEVVAEGPRDSCTRLLDLLREQAPGPSVPAGPRSSRPRPGRVTGVTHRWSAPRGGLDGFREA
jgi:acylphosphatase